MAYRPLEVTVISAKDLSDVNLFSKMEVYAFVMLANDTRSRKKTAVDREGGKNPTWNSTLKFNVMEFDADRAVLHIVLKSERALGDREIGEVHVPIRELLDGWSRAATGGSSAPAQFVSYQVRKNSGKAKGVLNISYKFGDPVTVATPPQYVADPAAAHAAPVVAAYPPPAGPAYPPPAAKPTADPVAAYPPYDTKGGATPNTKGGATPNTKGGSEPVTAYPVGAAGASSAYPPPGAYPYPPQSGYGYPPPPQAGYGAYPPQPGYGYPPQQATYGYPPQQGGYGYGAPVVQPQQPKKNKFGGAGAGLGLGLLGGALGGMILGDMVSDDAGAYDAGYDAGFDDGSGF